MKKILMGLGLIAAAGYAMAAPGDLDPSFGGSGWVAWSSPGISGEDVCIDANQRIVVAAARLPTGASAGSQTHLLRYGQTGLAQPFPNNVSWYPIGQATSAAQRPRVGCVQNQYTVVSMGPELSPGGARRLRLDVVQPGGQLSAQTWLDPLLLVREGSPAFAHLGGPNANWLIGQTRQVGSSWQALLQHWDAVSTQPFMVDPFSGATTGSTASFHDAARGPSVAVYAVGSIASTVSPGFRRPVIRTFDVSGTPINALPTGSTLEIAHDRSAEARRVLVGPDGEVHVAVQRAATATEASSIALHRFEFWPVQTQSVQIIADATVADIALDNYGMVIVVGERLGSAFVRRYYAGQLDTSFGTAGERSYAFGSNRARFNAVAIDANGRIVVTGRRETTQRGGATVPEALILARLSSW